jgi:hypothetical protein
MVLFTFGPIIVVVVPVQDVTLVGMSLRNSNVLISYVFAFPYHNPSICSAGTSNTCH